jgi:DNA-binding response OmpR family regulator
VNQVHKSVVNGRIVVVDDEPAICDSLQRLLELEGFNVVAVFNAADALAQLRQVKTDLLLLDVNLAGESGWDLCRLAREENPSLHVIIMTARPGQGTKAVTAGVDKLMEKPLDLPVLVETMRRLLSDRPRRRSGESSIASRIRS